MELDPVLLARIQFAVTIMFHYIFPPLTIGLATLMVIMEACHLKTGNKLYHDMAHFWTKMFAISFVLGVASGIVMEFQFGTNWSVYSRYVGDVFGSALAIEGIFAFFMESGFLAILVFGRNRVSSKMHLFSTFMVALGATFSATWIIIANSWQQTPAGFHLVEHGSSIRAEMVDFWAVVFNPSSMIRLGHTLVGAYINGAFFVLAVSAYYLLKNIHVEFAKKCISIALPFALFFCLLSLYTGHIQAQSVGKYQPTKLAAFEGHFKTGAADMYAWGIPNEEEKKVDYGFRIPGGLSFLMHGNFSQEVDGLDKSPQDEWPPLGITFQSYHIMIAFGMAMIGLTGLAFIFFLKGNLFQQKWLLFLFIPALILPFICNQAGWIAAEVGRQPWIVYGLLKTKDAISNVSPVLVLTSLIIFCIVYSVLFVLWLHFLGKQIKKGPESI
ncbi:MAG: cytochrome ubiquinol oxidase subunit I [Deltaproteobacteria bacterium]|nr:cytochrome ubiquinol oxidase subunit I [Deltaproteobacteria bacterium]